MIFKTYNSDLDGLSSKLGFSKRSFAEWGNQVTASWKQAATTGQKFKNALHTAFVDSDNSIPITLYQKTDFGKGQVFDNNKNSTSFFSNFNKKSSQSLFNLTAWCDRIKVADKNMRNYLTDCMQKQVPASYNGYVAYTNKAIDATNRMSLSFKASQVASKAFAIAGNMLTMMAVIKIISAVTQKIQDFGRAAEIAVETTKESLEDYKSVTSELKSLQDELDNTKSKILELEYSGSLSLSDENDLNNLRTETAELERQIALLKQKQIIAAKDLAKNAEDAFNEGQFTGEHGYQSNQNAFHFAIEDYSGFQDAVKEKQQALDSFIAANGMSDDAAIRGLGDISKHQLAILQQNLRLAEQAFTEAQNRVEDSYAPSASLIDSYNEILANGGELNTVQQTLYEQALDNQDAYFRYSYAVYANAEAYKVLSEESKKYAAAQKLINQGLNREQANSVISNLSDEDLDLFYGVTFDFPAPDPDDYTSAEEYGKAYALAMMNGVHETLLKNKSNVFILSDTQSQSIDAYQAKLKSLGDTLLSLQNGDSINYTDLIQEFPSLLEETENLDLAIKDLIYHELEKLYALLGNYVPNGLKESLQALADEASGLTTPLNDSFAAIQTSYEALQEFSSAFTNNRLSDAVLSSVAGLSSELNTLVAGFYTGAVGADQLYSALTEHYHNDLQNFGNATLSKNAMNESFYQALGLNSAELANSFLENYGIDISNCKSYNEAKIEIEKQTLQTIGSLWSRYYNAQTKSFTPQMESLAQTAYSAASIGVKDKDNTALQQYISIKEQAEAYEKAMETLNNVAYDGINANFKGIGSTFDKNTSSSSNAASSAAETAETFNWLETAISRVKRTITNLGKTVSAAYQQWSSKNDAIGAQISAVTKEISLQQFAYQKYMDKANSVGLPEYYKQLVQNGGLSVEDIADETLKGQIKLYKEYYEKALDASDAVQDLRASLSSLAKTAYENLTKKYAIDTGSIDHTQNMINLEIKRSESLNEIAGAALYEELMEQERKKLQVLESEYEEKERGIRFLGSSGMIRYGDDAWYDMKTDLDGVAESIQEAKNNLIEFESKRKQVAKQKFDNLSEQFDNTIGLETDKSDLLNAYLEQAEASGKIADTSLYQKLIETRRTEADTLQQKLKSLTASLESAMADGSVSEASSEWSEMKAAINDTEIAIVNTDTAILKLQDSLKSVAVQKFDEIASQFDRTIGLIGSKMDIVQKHISLVEESGHIVGKQYYETLIAGERETLDELKDEYSKLSGSLSLALKDGNVKEYDDNWYEMVNAINDTERSILDADAALMQYTNSMRQLDWDLFDRMQDSFTGLADESGFLVELMSKNNKLYDEYGNMNERGLSVQGLHTVNYELYLRQAKEYANELSSIGRQLAEDPGNTVLIDRYDQLLSLQQQAIINSEDEKSSIKELVSGGYDIMLSSLDDLIGKRKEALRAEKDLYDYEKQISKQTEAVSSYEKQLLAYSGDTSEETQAVVQRIQLSLLEAKEALAETEYEKYISDQERIFDTLYSQMEEWISTRLDDINGLLSQAIEATNKSADVISGQINKDVTGVGAALSQQMWNVWHSSDSNHVVTKFYQGFCDKMTSLSNVMAEIQSGIKSLPKAALPETAAIGLPSGLTTLSFYDQPLLRNYIPSLTAPASLPAVTAAQVSHNDIHMELTLPNVRNYEDFVSKMQSDRRFERIVQQMTIGNALGKNSYSKMKF